MDIEEEISIAYTLTKGLKKRREKEKPHKEQVSRIFQGREAKVHICIYTFSKSLLVFHLLGGHICWL